MSFTAGLIGGIGSAIGGALFGDSGASDAAATAQQSAADAGIKSSMANQVPPPAAEVETSGSQAGTELLTKTLRDTAGSIAKGAGAQASKKALEGLFGNTAANAGKDARAYMDNAYPELNPWEKAGAGGAGAGAQLAGQDQVSKTAKLQFDTQKEIAEMNNQTELKKAGIASATSIQNTKEQVWAQNSKLDLEKGLMLANISKAYASGSLTDRQAEHEVVKMAETYARTLGLNATTEQTRWLTEKVKEEIPKIRYSGHGTEQFKSLMNIWTDMLRKGAGVEGPINFMDDPKEYKNKTGGIGSSMR